MTNSGSYTEVCKDSRGNVKYFFNINEEKRTVVAIIPNRRFEVIDIFYAFVQKYKKTTNLPIEILCGYPFDADERLFIPDKFIGAARCAPNDTFDVEFGKRLALARAKVKMSYSLMNTFYNFVESIDEFSYALGKKYDKLSDGFYNAINHLDQIEEEAYHGEVDE